ncbi:hypothetical protein TPHA_0E01170 [Tetrapisispora phaffii CBS 4417]|uniref:Uncharacterized protein n=1 Tax=Tetrapisispora phaffii (strain ATCC 24235 / CBS 4417 / NBRC 1672 / NRRL Y-8282 / UCD 70-5) TaxID=1071381 RepID=G8BTI3_TETPH|nr:hypothetical protein TPHA_0E01170 [Tetrapisispora phaffii CBS 4417]CCE63211.1 hypothetical protein TPHA_0E01170 [Tetrapisispora phaffii CBS 4417]
MKRPYEEVDSIEEENHSAIDNASNLQVEDVLDDYESDNEDDDLEFDEEVNWEDVPLVSKFDEQSGVSKSQILNISISTDKFIGSRPKRAKKQVTKLKKLKYGLNIIEIPFFLRTLKERSKLCLDERLNRRLKRSIPKIIGKKFDCLAKQDSNAQNDRLRTLLLGAVLWFRSNYKINSNGFRQNHYRLDYLIRNSGCSVNKKFNHVLDNEQLYYGSRPLIDNLSENIREMAKNKMCNRDYLVFFFVIILKNLLKDKYSYSLRICFALPTHDFDTNYSNAVSMIDNDLSIVPNRFDSDLLKPVFWIELLFQHRHIYVIDPIVSIEESSMISRYNIDEPIGIFSCDKHFLNKDQCFNYVVGIDIETQIISDISPRYLPNLCYRYFNVSDFNPIFKTLSFRSYQYFKKTIKKLNLEHSKFSFNNDLLMRHLTRQNYELPSTYKGFYKSKNFILPSQLKTLQFLKMGSNPIGSFTYTLNSQTISELIYWRSDVTILKSRQNWSILGYSIKRNEEPRKLKKFTLLKSKRESKYHQYSISELYSIDQVSKTPKLPIHYTYINGIKGVNPDPLCYKGQYNNVEIFDLDIVPDGFKLLNLYMRESNINVRNLIKKYNKETVRSDNLKYIDVVTGFDFKKKPGFAMPKVTHIMLNCHDFNILQKLINEQIEASRLMLWSELISRIKINDRIDKGSS